VKWNIPDRVNKDQSHPGGLPSHSKTLESTRTYSSPVIDNNHSHTHTEPMSLSSVDTENMEIYHLHRRNQPHTCTGAVPYYRMCQKIPHTCCMGCCSMCSQILSYMCKLTIQLPNYMSFRSDCKGHGHRCCSS
jgi:hypothetical protein